MEIEELIMDPENADVYYCPRLSTKNCRCVEEFVKKHCWMNANLGTPADAIKLLKDLRKEALGLSNERFTRNEFKKINDNGTRLKFRGTGRIKSKKYVQYIVETRGKLRSHGICEIAAQNILKYSSKIIYSNLKYDYEKTNDLIADEKSNLKRNNKLLPIEELMEVRCCKCGPDSVAFAWRQCLY
ncbi:hypothetical protein RF11_09393 [Thelohanellus kitauei]|uniref:Uncharacterized protein n=1 Tax=Thelohanellus kitauei TaxID=669202 RepID=A0A0C2MKA0_THEKT|nr:hypothetical protein RF11_09393 [Thelohanellus kitauei]